MSDRGIIATTPPDTQNHDHDSSAKASGRCNVFQEFRVQGVGSYS